LVIFVVVGDRLTATASLPEVDALCVALPE